MKIYTRTGDAGTTGLFGGARVDKDDPRVEAYGTVDELCSMIGAARAAGAPGPIEDLLGQIQGELFQLGAELACAEGKHSKLGVSLIGQDDVDRLERAIDETSAELPPLTSFILPGGGHAGSLLHVARAVCRRAERRLLTASRSTTMRPLCGVYLNRLADLLFMLARAANRADGVGEAPWQPRATARPANPTGIDP